ncbi:hypothetical protein SNEBB_002702, partial [Seison nebaliae]
VGGYNGGVGGSVQCSVLGSRQFDVSPFLGKVDLKFHFGKNVNFERKEELMGDWLCRTKAMQHINGGKKLVLIWRTGYLSYHCNGLWRDGFKGTVRDFIAEYRNKYDRRHRMCVVGLHGILEDDKGRCLEAVLNDIV